MGTSQTIVRPTQGEAGRGGYRGQAGRAPECALGRQADSQVNHDEDEQAGGGDEKPRLPWSEPLAVGRDLTL